MWRAADGSVTGRRHRERQTQAASSRTVRQATERSVDAQILHVRRVGHQSHSRIGIIKVVITVMREEMADPARLLASTPDFFGDALDRHNIRS